MVALVKDTIADEELHREPPQKLLVINTCTLRVFLSLKVPFHLMKLGFICYLFSLNVTAMCEFIQPFDGNLGSFIIPPDLEPDRIHLGNQQGSVSQHILSQPASSPYQSAASFLKIGRASCRERV